MSIKSQPIINIVICLALSLYTLQISADPVNECIRITNDNKRLICYDVLFRSVNKKSKKNTSNSTNGQALTTDISINSDNKLGYQVDLDKHAVEKKSDLATEFGKQKLKKIDPSYITSRIVGEVSGWNKNSVFTLENGQKWRAVKGNTRTRNITPKLKNPNVTITKGILGSYNLKIKNVNSSIKVKRIK